MMMEQVIGSEECKNDSIDTPSSSTQNESTLSRFGLTFGNKTLLFRIANKEDLLKNKYFCKFCTDVYFDDFEKFKAHIQVHKNEDGKKKCTHCETRFVSGRALAIHCRFAHGDTLGFICNCGKQFTSKQYLNLHVRSHAVGDRFFCHQCGNWYRTENELLEHGKHCSKEIGRYSCEFCSKKFKYPKEKILHERSHTGLKPFECQYCEICFSQASALTTHERIHRKDKIHKCRFCTSKYTDSSSVRRHELSVHYKQCQQFAKNNSHF